MERGGGTENSDSLDRAAVTQVLGGDRRAFTGIYRRNVRYIRIVGNRLLRKPPEVDDFIQDVFLKAFTHLRSYRGTGQFRSWLLRIAYTTAINTRKRTTEERPLDPMILDVTIPVERDSQPENQVLVHEAIRFVREALAALPAQYARILELACFFRLKYREIAEIIDIPVGTIKAQAFRARILLRRQLLASRLFP